MGLAKKLGEWQAAGLISAEQADAITAHERSRKGGRFMKGLIAAALFAILCGVLSIIAANWAEIPGSVKIGAHIILNIGIAALLWRTHDETRREGLCLILFGLTLTLIVLIGQVFQLGGGWANALMLWMVITAPLMMFYGETKINAVPWMIAFLVSVYVVMGDYLHELADIWGALFAAGTAAFLPLALIADGHIRSIRRYKPIWADVFIRAGFAMLLVFASVSSIFWYEGRGEAIAHMAQEADWSAGAVHAALVGIFAAALFMQLAYGAWKNFYRNNEDYKAGAMIAALCVFFMGLPVFVTMEGGGPIASLHLILLWLGVGYIAQARGWQRLVSLSILIITLRIFIIYVELFGSLMTTGIGLISGGVVMLALIYGARKLNKSLRAA